MEPQDLIVLASAISALVAAFGAGITSYIAYRKLNIETKKLEAEEDSEIAEGALSNMEGAKISNAMLMDRVEDLRSQLESEKQARRSDAEYFRRRIREIERESRDYRLWAAKLARQVIEAGKQPVQFVSSFVDSETFITPVTKEQIEADRNKNK